MSDKLVIYHGSCTDGFTAAWVARTALGPDVEYVEGRYQTSQELNVEGKDVLVFDFSFPRKDTLRLAAAARSFKVIDHHDSAEKDVGDLKFCYFDQTKSGAMLAWDHFYDEEPPLLVKYVQRDLWHHALPHTREISALINSYERTWENWSALSSQLDMSFASSVREGSALLRQRRRNIASLTKHAQLMTFAGYDEVPVVNTPGFFVSELCHDLAETAKHHFAVGWSQGSDGRFKYSLRSVGDMDVSALCFKFGGGGHKHSAGFVSNSAPWEIV